MYLVVWEKAQNEVLLKSYPEPIKSNQSWLESW